MPEVAAHAWVLLPLAVSITLDFLLLDGKSFWLDELYSYTFATLPLSDFWTTVSQYEGNMVLYYVLLRLWLTVGDSPFWIRTLSALLGVGVVASTYVLATRLFGRRAGLSAALLLAINPSVVAYAQEARAYTLFLLLVLYSNVLYIRAVENGRASTWVAYAVTISLAVYSHFFGALVLLAQAVALLVVFRSQRPSPRVLVVVALVVTILVSPLALFVINSSAGGIAWISRPGLRALVGIFATMAGNKWVLVPYATVSLFGVLRATREQSLAWGRTRFRYCLFLLIWLVLPVVVAFAVSQVKPLFVDRYLIAGVPALIILGALGLDAIRRSSRMYAVMLIIIALTVPPLIQYYGTEKEDWRGATHRVLAGASEGDAVLFFVSLGRNAFELYSKHERHAWPTPHIVDVPARPRSFERFTPPPGFLEHLARDHPRVWLVLGHIRDRNRPFSTSLEEALALVYPAEVEWRLYGVQVLLFCAGDSRDIAATNASPCYRTQK
jgi:mannosyltransferase